MRGTCVENFSLAQSPVYIQRTLLNSARSQKHQHRPSRFFIFFGNKTSFVLDPIAVFSPVASSSTPIALLQFPRPSHSASFPWAQKSRLQRSISWASFYCVHWRSCFSIYVFCLTTSIFVVFSKLEFGAFYIICIRRLMRRRMADTWSAISRAEKHVIPQCI